MTPVTSGCQFASTASRFMPLTTSVSVSAPTSVPEQAADAAERATCRR